MAAMTAMVMVAGMIHAKAVTTNLVQKINFSLVFYEQGNTNQNVKKGVLRTTTVAVNTMRMTTRDLIAALGTATTNSFSAKAQLVFVRDANSLSNAAAVQVRDGTNVVDVSSFFCENERRHHGAWFGARQR